jgi:cell division septation protein DedD
MKTSSEPAADEGFHEIHLSGKQLVFLCMATTVVSVVIFLCGVLVGRGVRSAQGDGTLVASAASLPDAPGAGDAAADPSALDMEPLAEAIPADELSYPRRLEERDAQETVGSGPPPADARPADSVPVPAGTSSMPQPVTTAGPAAAAPAPAPATPETRSGYVVQVAAVHTRAEADDMAKRLSEKGYPSYVVDPPNGVPNAIFRVRVGGYPDRKQAQEISQRLEREEHFKSPWITR